jgi:hypothetical protein
MAASNITRAKQVMRVEKATKVKGMLLLFLCQPVPAKLHCPGCDKRTTKACNVQVSEGTMVARLTSNGAA